MKIKTVLNGVLAILLALVLAAYLMPKSDYDIAVEENEYWCDSVSNGYWHSSQETYVKRCGE